MITRPQRAVTVMRALDTVTVLSATGESLYDNQAEGEPGGSPRVGQPVHFSVSSAAINRMKRTKTMADKTPTLGIPTTGLTGGEIWVEPGHKRESIWPRTRPSGPATGGRRDASPG
jgi:hypothetical protein